MGLDRSWRKQILKSIATNSSPILELSSLISRQTMAKTQPNLFAAYEKKNFFSVCEKTTKLENTTIIESLTIFSYRKYV